MKPRKSRFILTAASALLLAPTAFAADGTWNTTVTPSSWNTPGNWLAATADGAGFTANFNTLDIPADTTITLDVDRTIGNLIFGDTTTSSAAGWILTAGDPAGKLTLAAATPSITVNALGAGKNASITATLEGTSGFTKDGTGTLVLNNTTNTISGAVVLSAGNLNIQSRPLINATSVAINGGLLVSATAAFKPLGDAVISFGSGTLQYNTDPTWDYSSQFSTAADQPYRINVQANRTATFASDLSSPGGTLTKLAAGTLVLAGPNTFTGNTIIHAGTLEISHALALQNSPINTTSTVVGTATSGIVLTAVTSPTFGGLTGTKALASLFNTDSGNYNLINNVTLNPGTGADFTYSAAIAEGATGMTLTKSGPGRQVLAAANTYIGGTILSGGTLNYGNATALSGGAISFTGNTTLQAGVATTLANNLSVATGVNGTVDTNGNATTLGGIITGDGNLSKTGAGMLNISGGGASNTLSGAINVNSGTLAIDQGSPAPAFQSFAGMNGDVTVASGATFNFSQSFITGDENSLDNDITLSGSGTGGLGALNLFRNAIATGTITLAADATISHTFNNATISGSITGTDRNLSLTTTVAGQAGMVISGPISLGSGGITVTGAANSGTFSIKLSGTNSYTGETRVVSGTLMLSGDARINDSSTVRIDSGAVLNLDFEGTDTVGALFLPGDPNPKPEGTYGSLTSSATNKSADFAGDGILQVGGVTNDFASWASSQVPPVTGGPNGDDDNDGVSNLVEYALIDGGERGVLSGNTITFTKRGTPYGGDLTYIVETSETLSGSWTPEVTHGPAELGSPISYNLAPAPGTPKKFARLKVVTTP
jgi:autotransporter-associated beta strand protein